MSIVGAWSNSVTVTTGAPPVFGPNPYYEKLAGLGFSWALRSISNGIWYDHFGNHNGILLGNPTVIDNPTDLNNLGFPTNLETVVSTDGLNDYVRVLHHDDLVRVLDGAEPMRNDYRRPVLHQVRQRILHKPLGF